VGFSGPLDRAVISTPLAVGIEGESRQNDPMGRPRLVDGRLERRLERLLDAGVSQGDAAKVVGVSLRTVNRWVAAKRARTTSDREPETLDQLLARYEAKFEEEPTTSRDW